MATSEQMREIWTRPGQREKYIALFKAARARNPRYGAQGSLFIPDGVLPPRHLDLKAYYAAYHAYRYKNDSEYRERHRKQARARAAAIRLTEGKAKR